jgi:hypothetical protein
MKFIEFVLFSNGRILCDTEMRNFYFILQKLPSVIYAQKPRQRHYLGTRITILIIFITNHTIYIDCDVSIVL